ncbi:uncharacterized protein LOC103394369 isoform X3 [Cynoglossus semilaevis]|uniref:uncharacterized protein LOC103394369 isoform X3 n=1 Tax=Cynoglossus semilaevis TaxID=244447 RepID=UPI000D631656|nr:uncharacterized protein LOC103394369 isoform X3 [Cynoglossus semilaevis]XP_024921052.1 uncharacterized protein LOC103394369 isoform X3 [Cynoglossus semilaevis]
MSTFNSSLHISLKCVMFCILTYDFATNCYCFGFPGGAAKRALPEFKDILHYLDYLQLDEPIIGLDYVQGVPSDELGNLKYLCGLCRLTSNLSEMVHHLIGRKHRQRYVEVKRPDLVTWEKNISINQAGKIIRAKAEIIERQDGRGVPTLLTKKANENKLNKSKAPAKQWKTWVQNPAHSEKSAQTHSRGRREYGNEFSHTGRYNPEFSDVRPYPPEEPHSSRERLMYHPMGDFRDDHHREYRENANRHQYMDPDNGMNYGGDSYGRTTCEPGGDQYHPEEIPLPHGQTRHVYEYDPEESASYSRPLPDRDPLKEFFFEEVQLQKHSEYHHSKVERQWPLNENYSRHISTSTASTQALREPEAMRSFSGQRGNNTAALYNIIKDYQRTVREPSKESETKGRKVEITKSMSGIPEPFKRFLTGANSDEQPGTRKRKSRFSDATAEEEVSMVRNEYEPPHSKYSSSSRPGSHSDFYTGSQKSQYAEQFRGEESEPVFNMLKGVEIENAEEAEFLKNKLCGLLKEFRTRKSERTMDQEDLDLRRSQNHSMRDDHRGPDWRRQDCPPEERFQGNAVRGENSHRSRYEEVFGVHGASRLHGSSYLDEPSHYSERFEEPMPPRGYHHGAREYFDSHSHPPAQNLEGSHYSNKLDKITSTLLQLVSRK